MNASKSGLHPIDQPIAAGTIQVTLRDAARAGESVAIECVYQPYREWDVIKQRHLHLLGSPFRIGSGLASVQREESHTVRQEIRPTDTSAKFNVALRDPDADHARYQLASVRVASSRAGTQEFKRWFREMPQLDPGFGLICSPERLGGTIRPSGLGAGPLRGDLPLWPALRTVDLTFAPVESPTIQLWDASAKHHWDGWRQSIPQNWPGGRTIVARQLAAPTVWRSHEYSAIAPADASTMTRPMPPAGTPPGVELEIFWPGNETLDFPDIRLKGDVDITAMPVARLTARAREILTLSTTLRPGLELHSVSAAESEELDALAVESDVVPIAQEMKAAPNGDDLMQIQRRGQLNEP